MSSSPAPPLPRRPRPPRGRLPKSGGSEQAGAARRRGRAEQAAGLGAPAARAAESVPGPDRVAAAPGGWPRASGAHSAARGCRDPKAGLGWDASCGVAESGEWGGELWPRPWTGLRVPWSLGVSGCRSACSARAERVAVGAR